MKKMREREKVEIDRTALWEIITRVGYIAEERLTYKGNIYII